MSAVTNPSDLASPGGAKTRRRMSRGPRILFFVTAWLIVLMPFLFWWNTWFGRQLSDKQLNDYLHDDKKPRHIQHALVQIGERMSRQDGSVARWYPDIVRLASYRVEEVRNTDAWVMGQGAPAKNASGRDFHEALLKMLSDPSLMVRGNAALSLVRFGDASGRPQIRALLEPAKITAPQPGKVIDTSKIGTPIHQGGIVAKMENEGHTIEVRSPITGRLADAFVRTGQVVNAGEKIATLEPGPDQVWEALRALYLIGEPEDIPAIQPYERGLLPVPEHVREQAVATEKAIRQRER
jgi:biotin-dependent enzyme